MRFFSLALCGFTVCAFAQRSVVFEDRAGLLLANDKLELTVLTTGGSFASLVLRDDPAKLNPMWNPARMAREGGQPRHTSPSLGHFVCVDGFGPVSEEEQASGLGGHGEAHRQPWEMISYEKSGKTLTARFRANLPLLHETFTRTIRMVDGENIVWVDSELENKLAFDRPVNWAEHATIGAPFLEPQKTVVDMPARQARTRFHPPKPGALPRRLAPSRDFTWPMAPTADGKTVDVRAAPQSPNSLDHTTCLLDPNRELVFVTALNLEKRLLIGYLFRQEEFPWLQSWENYPPTLRMARGLEFSTQPFDVSRRQAISTGALFNTPTYRWLPARSKIGSRFLMFYTQAPEGFTRVDEVTLFGGNLTIEDRRSGKRIVLTASRPL